MARVASISQQIWDMKYRFKDTDGTPRDRTMEDSWRRVAKALAACESQPDLWARRFYEALSDFRLLPAGRILAGAGTERQVTLFNCFVMGDIPDTMSGIFDQLKCISLVRLMQVLLGMALIVRITWFASRIWGWEILRPGTKSFPQSEKSFPHQKWNHCRFSGVLFFTKLKKFG